MDSTIALGVVLVLSLWLLSGCAHNPCIDNPRNMLCMTADELEDEF